MAWSFVGDSNAANSASGTTLSTPAANNTAGNHLAVFVVYSSTGTTTTTISDTAGNTFTPLTLFQAAGQLLWGQWFYCLNAKGNASNVVTMTLGAARSNRIIRVLEFSSPSAVLDQEITPVTNTGTSISSGSFNTPRDGIVLAGEINWNSDTSTNFGTNYTALSSLQNYSKQAYRIDSGALTGEVVTYSSTVSTNRGLGGASFVTASASGQTVAPTGATVILAGSSPVISQAVVISPGGVSISLIGAAPTVSQAQIIAPAGTMLSITGYAPTIIQVSPQTIAPAGTTITLTGYAPQVWFGGNVPVFPIATIMRANSVPAQGGTMSSRKDLSGGAMTSTIALATIMRDQAASRTAAIHSDPINLTVSFP